MEQNFTTKIKKRAIGIKVHDMYNLPFKSQGDWKVTLFQKMKDLYHFEILKVIDRYKDREAEIESDGDAVLWLAAQKKLFENVNKEVLKKVRGAY